MVGVPAQGHLQDVVQDHVAEALAGGSQDAGGLVHLMRFVACGLRIPGQSCLLLLAHLLKLLLRLLELPEVPAMEPMCSD